MSGVMLVKMSDIVIKKKIKKKLKKMFMKSISIIHGVWGHVKCKLTFFSPVTTCLKYISQLTIVA